ncbi:NfeD family protein [Hydrogenovibrio sp. JE_KL2]|uniref:NfeD family protein n=1 Tax=Hydrogenovibrio sp. JE_KL2 TaxID=2651188 RepID=UPI00128DDE33|nr:NfeD family protein [Hydrogenovibrio sp. JE_KL2]MPQ76501.1 NfeD family protein [Hydrogenovibrio sp. JE_KL2]
MLELLIGQSLNPSLLIIIGLVLMVGEVTIVGTFVLFWLALAAILIGALSFVLTITWQWQLVWITVLGSLFTWLLNPYLKKRRHTQEESAFSPSQAAEMGRLHQNKDGSWSVFYKGTYWLVASGFDPEQKQSGDAIQVYGVEGTKVVLTPPQND